MLPYIEIFSRPIPMYSVAAATGFLLSLLYLSLAVKRYRTLEAEVELVFTYGIMGAFVGAKLLSILSVFPTFLAELPYLFTDTTHFLQKYLYSGFVFYGGLYGMLFSVWAYARMSRLNFSDLLTFFLPVVPLFHSLGRIGCFCMGCCYGIPTPFGGIAFHHSEIAPNDLPLFPVQLLEAAVELLLFLLLARSSKNQKSGLHMLGGYLTTYGAARFCLEFLRGDLYRGFIGPLSLSQVISLLSISFGLVILLKVSKAVAER